MDQVSPLRIAFIKAQWHSDIVNQCYTACANTFGTQATLDVIDVPGAFEIPLLAQNLAKTGQYDAIIASALVVDGGIYRHEFVAQAVINGLMQAQLATGTPILSAVLTPHHYHETKEHQQFFFEHFKVKGKEVAEACLSLLKTQKSIISSVELWKKAS